MATGTKQHQEQSHPAGQERATPQDGGSSAGRDATSADYQPESGQPDEARAKTGRDVSEGKRDPRDDI